MINLSQIPSKSSDKVQRPIAAKTKRGPRQTKSLKTPRGDSARNELRLACQQVERMMCLRRELDERYQKQKTPLTASDLAYFEDILFAALPLLKRLARIQTGGFWMATALAGDDDLTRVINSRNRDTERGLWIAVAAIRLGGYLRSNPRSLDRPLAKYVLGCLHQAGCAQPARSLNEIEERVDNLQNAIARTGYLTGKKRGDTIVGELVGLGERQVREYRKMYREPAEILAPK